MILYRRFFDAECAWYICRDNGTICEHLYGPFNDIEIELSAQIHIKEKHT